MRRKRVLELAKGFFGRKKNVWTVAKNAVEKGLVYAYRDRKAKKRDFRSLWIQRINAGARLHGMSYSEFMGKIKKSGIDLNRKVLADLAMNHPEAFRVYRTPEGQPHRLKRWRPLRKAVADLPRRAQISRAANHRYIAALAAVPTDEAAGTLARPICQPIVRRGRRHRALNPWGQSDATLLQTIARGEWTVNGFRNRDLRGALYKQTADASERRRQAGGVTRLLALLRAHGLIRKVTGTHRYIITPKGRELTTTLLAAQQASVKQLIKLAA